MPNPDFHGTNNSTFKVKDDLLASSPAQVSITLQPVNDAPVAYSQSVTNLEDTPRLIELIGSDVEATPLAFILLSAPTYGQP